MPVGSEAIMVSIDRLPVRTTLPGPICGSSPATLLLSAGDCGTSPTRPMFADLRKAIPCANRSR